MMPNSICSTAYAVAGKNWAWQCANGLGGDGAPGLDVRRPRTNLGIQDFDP